MIFDTHCHLNSEELYNRLDEVIKSSRDVGVDKFLVVGWDKKSSFLAVELAEKYDFIYAAIGFHPCDIFDLSEEDFEQTMALFSHPKVVAIGEIGLDYHWEKEPERRALQKAYFIRQIEFANEHKLPISIHNRDAFEDCLKILKEHIPLFGGVMHCYSGSVESLKEVMDLGLNISLGGPLTFTNAKTSKLVAKEVPLGRVVVETDAPYLSPHPLRGTVNEPKNISLVIDELAKIKEISREEMEKILYENSCKMFHV